jgi:predicted GTPase
MYVSYGENLSKETTDQPSSVINEASGSEFAIGRGLESCTSEVQATKPFKLNGREVTLIDTPGFDDTSRSDTDILAMIGAYLSQTSVFTIILFPLLTQMI